MRVTYLLPFLAAGRVLSQDDTATNTREQDISESLADIASAISTTIDDATVPTGDYITYSSTVYLTDDGTVAGSTAVQVTGAPGSNETTAANATVTSTSNSVTVLMGGQQTTLTGNSTANSSMSATPSPSSTPVVNTQPCNGYTEFCERKYSNITMIAAHNSPFNIKGNVAANQALDVEYQLDDGVRMRTYIR